MNLVRLPDVSRLIDLALAEDLGRGDVTSESVLDGAGEEVIGAVTAREPLVLSGLGVAAEVFARVDPQIELTAHAAEGAALSAGARALTLRGPPGPILAGERTALNFLARLSGVATTTRRFVEAVAGTGARVACTRKTTPGWRVLEKAAVRAGGGHNHRSDLGSGVLIKDNHIVAAGSVRAAVERALARAPHPLKIEVEVTSDEELEEAIAAGAHMVLLDNMSPAQVAMSARRARDAGLTVEASGGITLSTARAYAEAGIDILSVGALTHSAPAVDLALDLAPEARAADAPRAVAPRRAEGI